MTHAYSEAMSSMLTVNPECISPEAATPIHIQTTAVVAFEAYDAATMKTPAPIAPENLIEIMFY